MKTGLTCTALTISYGDFEVNLPTVKLARGDSLLLKGKSGSGKSTLLHTLCGLLKPKKGKVQFGSRDIYAMDAAERDAWRGSHIGFVFQQFHLSPLLNVRENIELSAWLSGAVVDEKWQAALFKRLGIQNLLTRKISEISHGQAQRVAMARALIHKPAIVLADEPTSALDDDTARATISLLRIMCEEAGTSLLVASHDARISSFFKQSMTLKASA